MGGRVHLKPQARPQYTRKTNLSQHKPISYIPFQAPTEDSYLVAGCVYSPAASLGEGLTATTPTNPNILFPNHSTTEGARSALDALCESKPYHLCVFYLSGVAIATSKIKKNAAYILHTTPATVPIVAGSIINKKSWGIKSKTLNMLKKGCVHLKNAA